MPAEGSVEFDVVGSDLAALWMGAHTSVKGLLASHPVMDYKLRLVSIAAEDSMVTASMGLGTLSSVTTWRGTFVMSAYKLLDTP